MLVAWLPDLQVRRAFADWMRQIVERLVPSGVELPPIRKLEDSLAELLAPITDAERLADIGDWLVQCDTGADFLARVAAAPAGGNSDRA